MDDDENHLPHPLVVSPSDLPAEVEEVSIKKLLILLSSHFHDFH